MLCKLALQLNITVIKLGNEMAQVKLITVPAIYSHCFFLTGRRVTRHPRIDF